MQNNSNNEPHIITVRKIVSEQKVNIFSSFVSSSESSKTRSTQILVPDDIQKDELNQCINHALCNGLSFDIPGLYRERDGVLIPISEIAKHPLHYKKDVLCFGQPVTTSSLCQKQNYISYILAIISMVSVGLIRMFFPSIQDFTVQNCSAYLLDVIIAKPIRKLYR